MTTQATFTGNPSVGFIRLLEPEEALGANRPKNGARVLLVGVRNDRKHHPALQEALRHISQDGSYVVGTPFTIPVNGTPLDPSISATFNSIVSGDPERLRGFLSELARSGVISEDEKREAVMDLRLHSATARLRQGKEEFFAYGGGI